jgi:hypothetical protein
MAIGLSAHAQNNLPKLATEIAPLLIGEKSLMSPLKSVKIQMLI